MTLAGTLAAQVLVLAKAPVPGLVKTRLTPPYSCTEAAGLAAAALEDTLDAVAATRVARRVLVLDGPSGGWQRPGLDVVPQRGGRLDERLAAAYDDAWAGRALPMLLIGMDTPQAGSELLTAAVRELLGDGVDAVLGPAVDGGFWALGLRRPDARLLLGVPMSLPVTGAAQQARLRFAGLRVAALPMLTDVDTPESAARVAAALPESRFAALHGRLRREGAA